MRAKLTVGAEGEIAVPPRAAELLGVPPGGEIDLVGARGAFGLLTPARDASGAKAYFAGSLAALTVAEVVQFVFTSLKSGVLLLAFGREPEREVKADVPDRLRRRSIYFRDGQVVFASSSDPADRLGPVLVRHGALAAADLARCARLVGAGRPLGQVLVDEGILTAGQLYEGLTTQVKEILLASFLELDGEFAFLEGTQAEDNAVKLPERTRDLLLAGLKRAEEAERLAAELGGRGAVLRRGSVAGKEMFPEAQQLAAAVDGRRTLVEVASASGLGLLDALRYAAALVREGVLAATAEPPPAAPAPGGEEEVFSVEIAVTPEAAASPAPAARPSGPFETYRRIFRHVHEALSAVHEDAVARLNSYFDRLPPAQRPIFEGVRLADDGDVDVAQILVNVTATGAYKGAAARARSLEALEDYLAFALFEVKNCLPKKDADRILRTVGKMQMGKA